MLVSFFRIHCSILLMGLSATCVNTRQVYNQQVVQVLREEIPALRTGAPLVGPHVFRFFQKSVYGLHLHAIPIQPYQRVHTDCLLVNTYA